MEYYTKGISYEQVDEHYEIYVNGEFECSCDTGEIAETLLEVEKSLKSL